jgi:hypothetical protein
MLLINKLKRGSWPIAVLLNILTPGLGQCYNGNFTKGIIIYIIISLLTILFAFTNILLSFNGLVVSVLIFIGLYLYIIIDSIIHSNDNKDIRINIPNSSLYNTLIIISVIIYVSSLLISFDKYKIKSFKVNNMAMAPTLQTNDYVMASLNSFQPEFGDLVLFHPPNHKTFNIDTNSIFIFTCVGLPGEILKMENSNLFIDQELKTVKRKLHHNYHIKSSIEISEWFWEKNKINEPITVGEFEYIISTTKKNAERIKSYNFIDSIKQIQKLKNQFDLSIFPYDSLLQWNKDNFGSVYIPKKGETIPLNYKNIGVYKQILNDYEGLDSIHILDTSIYKSQQIIEHYQFKNNYYFVMGDNRDDAIDSRYWGFLPEYKILGKALYIYWSKEKDRIGISF